jgi:putative N6-adenine-specific DNA methylase
MIELFLTCSQGLEALLCQELAELGYPNSKEGFRGIFLSVPNTEAIYHINYCSRIASRVLLPIETFRCYTKDNLYKSVAAIDWSLYIPEGKTFAIDANVTHEQLRNSLFAAQLAKDAICDQLRAKRGRRPNIDVKNPDVQLNLYINKIHGVISFDTSGTPLHKRGYRQYSVEAPIQESLAASILKIAKYQGTEILFDPCCGSGTLLIEAAMMATKTPAGFLRKEWGFKYLPDFSFEEWLKIKNREDANRLPLKKGFILGAEVNPATVKACKANLRASGFLPFIEVIEVDFRNFEPKVLPNLIVTNPPHGNRLGEEEALKPLYRALGDFMKRRTAKPSKGFIFTGSLPLAKEVGLAAKRRYPILNSGIESRLLEFDLY